MRLAHRWLVVAMLLMFARRAPAADVFPAPRPGALYHGVYPGGTTGDEDAITPVTLGAYEQAARRHAAWVYFSHEWSHGRAFPNSTAGWIRAHGSVPYVRLMLRSSTDTSLPETLYTLRRILRGDFDADLHAWGAAARDFGTPLLAEWGTEMNGDWFAWNGAFNGADSLTGYGDPTQPDGPERFRDAWRHIVGIVRAEGATNVAWVFHVNAGDAPALAWNAFERYWPGVAWADWVGVSVYGAQTPLDEDWPQFRPQLDEAWPRLAALAAGKPVIVSEFGVTLGNPLGSAGAWADGALADLVTRRWPGVTGFSWWNEAWPNDDLPAHDTDMRVQDDAALTAAFRARVAADTVVSGAYPGPDTSHVPDVVVARASLAVQGSPSARRIVFRWAQPAPGRAVRLDVYDVTGRRAATLLDLPAGDASGVATWDASPASGGGAAPGLYVASLAWAGGRVTRKFVVAR